MLERIVQSVKARLDSYDRKAWLAQIEARLNEAGPVPSFRDALIRTKPAFIFEIKRKSPSSFAPSLEIDVAATARLYESSGASCISVLTEEHFFAGSLTDLESVREAVSIPLLRKDFILDEMQILEAKACGASAVLLIVGILSDDQLVTLRTKAAALGMDALVEVHDERELARAIQSGADIIGVNNRNLKTLDIDLSVGEALLRKIPSDIVRIAESGLKNRADVQRMGAAGADAFLIGTSVIRALSPADQIREIMTP